jgi:tripartite-type tricarboxylate transporter receptor subunit TctC
MTPKATAMIGRRAALSAGLALAPTLAGAQAHWPDRQIRLIVGYPAGGPSDIFARLVAAQMGPRLGQPVVVENRPGGGAVLASETAARAPADGHAWMHVDNGILVYNPALYARLPYDPDRDFTGVGFIGRFPLYIVCRAEAPWGDFAALVAATRARAATYGSPAVASPHHLAMELVKRRSGLAAEHVPYRGGQAAMQDLLGGNVDLVMIDTATGLPFIRDGRVRALAVLSEARTAEAPAVPTLRALGHDAVAFGWQGLSVPRGVPPAVVARLNAELVRAMGSEEVQGRTRALGIQTTGWSAAEFDAFVAAENALWRPLIRDLGIRLDA